MSIRRQRAIAGKGIALAEVPSVPSNGRRRVLVIDDNADHAEIVAAALRRHHAGVEVESVPTGREGLARVEEGSVDLAILDYQLPDGDGLLWLEKILERDSELPVVMVTGRGSEGVAADAFRKGAWDYVAKSLDYLDLLAGAVGRGLEKARLRRIGRQQAVEIAHWKQFNEDIISTLPLCLIVLDRDLKVILSNRRDAHLWAGTRCERGDSLEELFGRLGALEQARLLSMARRVLQTREASELAEVAWTAQGEEILTPPSATRTAHGTAETVLRVQMTPMLPGKEAALLLVVEDISAKKAMQKQVVAAGNKMEAIFGAITDTIVLLDRDLIIREIKGGRPGFTDQTAWYPIGGHCFRELVRREQVCPDCPVRQAFKTGRPASRVQPAVRADGSPAELYHSTYPLKDETGEVVQVVAYIKDVTEERRMMRQLEEARRLSALGEMVAGIAHEVKNPLQNIRLGLYLIQDELGERAEGLGSIFRGIEQGMRTIQEIVEELLDYARPLHLHRASWDLRQVVEGALYGQEAAVKRRGIRVVQELGEGPYEVWVDGMRMGQVLANLVTNAVESMAGGGVLRVWVGRRLLRGLPWLAVEVSDTGCGIPPQDLERVFDPFFTTKESGVGLGLGLAIAHRIVQLHDGRLEVISQVRQGTTFTVLLTPQNP